MPLATWPRCVGVLRHGPDVAPVVCAVTCADDGRLALAFEPIAYTTDTRWLCGRAYGSATAGVPFVTAELTAEDGTRLTSAEVYFTSVGTTTERGRVNLELGGRAATLTARPAPPAGAPRGEPGGAPPEAAGGGRPAELRYRTSGMRGFTAVTHPLPDGAVAVVGPATVEDDDALAGGVVLRRPAPPEALVALAAPPPDAVDEGGPEEAGAWLAECDARVESVLLVFSLALGHRIAWRVRELHVDGVYREAYFRSTGPSGPPREPLFSYLDLQPVLDLAVDRYTPALDEATGVGVAIAWLAAWSDYAELRVLGAATALEHLVSRWTDEPGAVVPAPVFRAHVRPALEEALRDPALAERTASGLAAAGTSAADADQAAADALALFGRKIGSLNGASLRDRVAPMLGHYRVPLDDIPVSVDALLETRNAVAHARRRDVGAAEVSVTRDAGLLREVVRRLVLAILEFEGHFYSHVRGPEWRAFRQPAP